MVLDTVVEVVVVVVAAVVVVTVGVAGKVAEVVAVAIVVFPVISKGFVLLSCSASIQSVPFLAALAVMFHKHSVLLFTMTG